MCSTLTPIDISGNNPIPSPSDVPSSGDVPSAGDIPSAGAVPLRPDDPDIDSGGNSALINRSSREYAFKLKNFNDQK